MGGEIGEGFISGLVLITVCRLKNTDKIPK